MRGIQLVPQLVPKQFNTLPTQYRHIEHFHEEVWYQNNVFWQNNSFLKWAFFSCLLLNKDFACAYTGKSTCTRAFTEGFWYFVLTIKIYWACAWRSVMPNNFFWLNNCFSKLAILYGLGILDISFLHWPLLRGVSDKHCLLSFFSLVLSCCGSYIFFNNFFKPYVNHSPIKSEMRSFKSNEKHVSEYRNTKST